MISGCENQLMVSFSPSSIEYPGDQSRSLFALVLSAHRRSTSLFSGLIRPESCKISMVVPISKAIFPARFPIEISELLPRLITSPAEVSASAALINPFAVSLTKLRFLVGVTDPSEIFFFPARIWVMMVGMMARLTGGGHKC